MKCFFRFYIFCFLTLNTFSAFSQSGMWTWISGSDQPGSLGIYGVQGIPSVNNCPPALYEYAEWTDLQGNFWLYGGWSPAYSDLWKYNPSSNEWTWIKGNGLTAQSSVHGTLGVPDPLNTPGARTFCAATWVDTSGNLWLFGGGPLFNDLWRYTITTNEWTWMSGSDQPGATGVYGTMGVPSILNVPTGRYETCSAWTDSLNNLWLFGGVVTNGSINDLWRFSISTSEWTWMTGSSMPFDMGSFGIKGLTDPTNCPSARASYTKWKDKSGNFWLMGGTRFPNRLDDVWKFDTGINQWTWMAGTDTMNHLGIYQSTCLLDSLNQPSARIEHRSAVADKCGRFWLFGGMQQVGDFLNDLWVYDPDLSAWSWVSGSNIPNQTNVYGVMGIPSPANHPASRWGGVSWWGNDNRFYLFGGNSNNAGPNYGDLWVFTPDSNCIPICDILPVAAVTSPNQICPGSCINFTNNSTDANSFEWIFTGASISNSTDSNPQNVCYYTPGNFDVTLIATNINGSDTLTLTGYITVFPFPPSQGILQIGDTLFANQGAVSYQWYLNNSIINGATNYFYVASQNGDYNVICTDTNNCEVEAVLNNVITRSSTPKGYLGFNIYPNPSTGELFLQTGNLKIDDITILAVTGKILLNIETSSRIIDVSALPDGYYFVELRIGDTVYRSRFIKNAKL